MVSGAPAMVRPAVSKPAHAASNFFAPLLFLSHPVLTRPTWEAAQFPVDRRVFECSVFTHGESSGSVWRVVKSEQSRIWRNSASPWDALLTLEVRSSCLRLNHIRKDNYYKVDSRLDSPLKGQPKRLMFSIFNQGLRDSTICGALPMEMGSFYEVSFQKI